MDTTNAIYGYGIALEKLGEWYMKYSRARCLKDNSDILFKLQCEYEDLILDVRRKQKKLCDLLDK